MSKLIEAFERGEGFYTVADVAFYARMHPITVRRWFLDRKRPLFRQGTSSYDPNLLSFTDLIEAIYVRKLRVEHHIQFNVIRTAIETARLLKKVDHPFAHPDFRTVVVGREINIIDKKDESKLIALAPNGGQISDRSILSDFINDLEFGENDRIIKHIAFKAPADRVIITPNFNLGEPMLESCGYTAETLWQASRTEGGIIQAAEAYGVSESAVQAAVDYYGGVLKAA